QLSCVRSGDPPSPSGKGQELAPRAERAGAVPAQSVLRRLALFVESDPVLDRLDARPPVALLDAEIPAGHAAGPRTARLVFRLAWPRHPGADATARQLRGLRDLRRGDGTPLEGQGRGSIARHDEQRCAVELIDRPQ